MADGWNYADVWEEVAGRFPDEAAAVHGPVVRTWKELDDRADGVARALLAADLERQDKVAAAKAKAAAALCGEGVENAIDKQLFNTVFKDAEAKIVRWNILDTGVRIDGRDVKTVRPIEAAAGLLPRAVAAPVMEKVGVDRMNALYSAIDIVRRGGTISLTGVYGGMADVIPMLTIFDKQIQLRGGQANIKRWIPEIMPLLVDDADPLGTEDFATHQVPLSEAPTAYEQFQKKTDGTVKVVFKPGVA